MVIKLRHLLFIVSSFGLMLLLSGCSNMVIFNPKGAIAVEEKQLLIDAVLLMSVIVVPVIIFTFLIARRYRASNTAAKYSPDWAHGTLLEAGWWVIPCVIVAVLATMTWRTSHQLDPYKPLVITPKYHGEPITKPVTIQVISLRWRWLFIYPEQKIATMNFVEFPANTAVTFLITSDAPMNSFQIPQLAGQIYSMAGMQTKLNLIANEPGKYDGRSVSFSGAGFTNMTFKADAVSENDFNKWVESVKKSPNQLTMTTYNQLTQPSLDNSTQYFSSVTDNLFSTVMMNFMMPMQKSNNPKQTPVHL